MMERKEKVITLVMIGKQSLLFVLKINVVCYFKNYTLCIKKALTTLMELKILNNHSRLCHFPHSVGLALVVEVVAEEEVPREGNLHIAAADMAAGMVAADTVADTY